MISNNNYDDLNRSQSNDEIFKIKGLKKTKLGRKLQKR